jgi:hypothetical protein
LGFDVLTTKGASRKSAFHGGFLLPALSHLRHCVVRARCTRPKQEFDLQHTEARGNALWLFSSSSVNPSLHHALGITFQTNSFACLTEQYQDSETDESPKRVSLRM